MLKKFYLHQLISLSIFKFFILLSTDSSYAISTSIDYSLKNTDFQYDLRLWIDSENREKIYPWILSKGPFGNLELFQEKTNLIENLRERNLFLHSIVDTFYSHQALKTGAFNHIKIEAPKKISIDRQDRIINFTVHKTLPHQDKMTQLLLDEINHISDLFKKNKNAEAYKKYVKISSSLKFLIENQTSLSDKEQILESIKLLSEEFFTDGIFNEILLSKDQAFITPKSTETGKALRHMMNVGYIYHPESLPTLAATLIFIESFFPSLVTQFNAVTARLLTQGMNGNQELVDKIIKMIVENSTQLKSSIKLIATFNSDEQRKIRDELIQFLCSQNRFYFPNIQEIFSDLVDRYLKYSLHQVDKD